MARASGAFHSPTQKLHRSCSTQPPPSAAKAGTIPAWSASSSTWPGMRSGNNALAPLAGRGVGNIAGRWPHTRRYDAEQLKGLSDTTIAYYYRSARAFWDGTRHHDVSHNHAAFLDPMESDPPCSILHLGSGPRPDFT